MRKRPIGAACAAVAFCLVPLSKSAMAAFPAQGTDTTTSLGQFSIVISPAFQGALAGAPGYDSTTHIFTSPLLFVQSTTIDRSNPTTAETPGPFAVGTPDNGTVNPKAATAIFSTVAASNPDWDDRSIPLASPLVSLLTGGGLIVAALLAALCLRLIGLSDTVSAGVV